jgi:hypothetical protein
MMNTKEKILIVDVIEKKNPPINSSSIVYAQIEGFSVLSQFLFNISQPMDLSNGTNVSSKRCSREKRCRGSGLFLIRIN